MANTVKMKRSAVPGKVPATTDLNLGEIAINTYDGKAYIKKNVSGTESIVPLGDAGSGDVTGPNSSTDNAIARFDGASGKIIQNSTGTIDDSGNASLASLSLTTDLAVTHGGTGSSTAAGARTNLGAQETLVSGTNIKTINSTSLLGSGNIAIPTGDVVGPASATDNAIARFDTTTGKLIQSSGASIDDSGNLSATALYATGTGANEMPAGTTAQRPASPVDGMYRLNTTLGQFELYYSGQWWPVKGVLQATGGTITEVNGYRIHTFTSSGTFQVINGAGDVEALIIAGGGGGGPGGSTIGAGGGGGGGAGGVIQLSAQAVAVGSYSVVVGAGGTGGASNTSGGNSSAFGNTAIGGGYGGRANSGTGVSGGSGGGGAGGTSGAPAASGGSGTSGQGFAGGTGLSRNGGGGGGASAVGQNSNGGEPSSGGNGGAGIYSSITGTQVSYAGGGGAGTGSGTPGTGGLGWGGNGSTDGNDDAQAGGTNKGAGGGGGSDTGTRFSGAGGSGIVIIRYKI